MAVTRASWSAVAGWTLSGVRLIAGVTLGGLTAVGTLVFLFLAGPVILLCGGQPRVIAAVARQLAEFERMRLTVLFDTEEGVGGFTGNRMLPYLAARCPVGLLGGAAVFLLGYGAVLAIAALAGWLTGNWPDNITPTWPVVLYLLVVSAVLLFLDLAGIAAVAAFERAVARSFLVPDDRKLMRRRIAELSVSRAGIVEAVDAERRRIERDLHDGLQQRVVALGMLLGRARRSGSADLVRQAHEESQRILEELREISWRVYPSALDNLGLADALDSVAERSAVPVRIQCEIADQPPPPVATAAYFTVREAVTNAAKHSSATMISVLVTRQDAATVVRITDDGVGGADPHGGGLAGLARRVAALDGQFSVVSPSGGPTVVEARLPCA